MKPSFLLFLLSLAVLASCQKASNDVPADASKLTWTLHAPHAQTQYRRGDTVRVLADVAYTTEMHGYELALADSATGASVWTADAHVHDDHFSISESWADTLSRPATLLLTLRVELDHDGHAADTTLRLYTQP